MNDQNCKIKSFNFLPDKYLMYFSIFGSNSMYKKMINFDVKGESAIAHNPNWSYTLEHP